MTIQPKILAPIRGFKGEYEWLSNFFPSVVWWEGVPFPTVEHGFQAAKTDDVDTHLMIAELPTPGLAKREGRRILLREDWEDVKDDIMYDLCKYKFRKEGNLAENLLNTGDVYIEETNNWNDTYWGVCKGIGQNKLGKILMRIRRELSKNS